MYIKICTVRDLTNIFSICQKFNIMIFSCYGVSSEDGFATKPTHEDKLIPSTKCLLTNTINRINFF